MKKTLTWELISQLDYKELKAFGVFLSSPYFNSRQDLIKINKFLTKHQLEKSTLPRKEEVYAAAFPEEAFDDKKLRLLLSYLHKILEKFIWIQEVEKTEFQEDKFLISAYRRNNMHRNFNRTLKKTQKRILEHPLRNPAHHFLRFELENQKYLSLLETGRAKELNLENVEKHLDLAYISSKLQQACFMLSHQAVFNKQYHAILFEEIMKLVQRDIYKNEPAINLYYRFIVLFEQGTASDFQEFRTLLFERHHHFTPEELRDIYLLALNFCIKKVNSNQQVFYAETFDMYKKGIEMGLLLIDGKLTSFSFNNIVGIAIRQNELSWVESFINTYKNTLDKTHKITSFSLNMARVEFANKNYNQALLHLRKADYEDPINHMTAKILRLKIHYELHEFETLDHFIQSLNAFISRRKRKLGYHYQIWKNILRYTQKVRKVNPYDKKAVDLLKTQITAEKILPEREWLLSKLKEMLC